MQETFHLLSFQIDQKIRSVVAIPLEKRQNQQDSAQAKEKWAKTKQHHYPIIGGTHFPRRKAASAPHLD